MKKFELTLMEVVIAAIEAYVAEHGVSFNQAVNDLILRGSKAPSNEEVIELCREVNQMTKDILNLSVKDKIKLGSGVKGRPKRQVSALGIVYNDYIAACTALGISQSALAQRIKNNPEEYFYINALDSTKQSTDLL